MNIQNQRLLKLASFVEALRPDQYNHQGYHCGTRGCALGWAAFAKDRLGFHELNVEFIGNTIAPMGTEISDEANRFFGPDAYDRIFRNYFERQHDGTQNGVVKALRAYAAELQGHDMPAHEPCEPEFKAQLDSVLARIGVATS